MWLSFEGLSLAEQMRQVRDVDVLMGVDGGGLANGNWLRNGSFVIDLVPYLNAVVRPDLATTFVACGICSACRC